jgi:homoserine/homoserine lactone efflux protein
MNGSLFAGFLAITLVLILTPGPIVTLVISTAATKGVRAGLITVAGTSSGTAVLLIAIALGLDWVLSHAVYLFELLRWAGAAYLIWLGIQAWRHAGQERPVSTGHHVQFFRGVLVALSNPKTIAFFTAFLPQFVDPNRRAEPQLAIMLGHCRGHGTRLVHETCACEVARARIWGHPDGWGHMAVAGTPSNPSVEVRLALPEAVGSVPNGVAL